ncbi:unnamed protein product [Cladocopium goreaui]|uniref:Histidine kinase n=1 Tax=Cladocopium goreaui TaxID=2562237 RepID=A0A9P1CRF3_9DINO|nr:unnamed protein product [Cladocopium goreaui]
MMESCSFLLGARSVHVEAAIHGRKALAELCPNRRTPMPALTFRTCPMLRCTGKAPTGRKPRFMRHHIAIRDPGNVQIEAKRTSFPCRRRSRRWQHGSFFWATLTEFFPFPQCLRISIWACLKIVYP